MVSFLKRHQTVIASLLLVLISLNLALSYRKEAPRDAVLNNLLAFAASPAQKAAAGAYRVIKGVMDDYIMLTGVNRENRALKKRLADLEADNNRLQEDAKQNSRLREILDYREKSAFRSITSGVVALNYDKWTRTAVIDKGTSDGIRNDMAVITPEGVVGRIIETHGRTSKVLLSSDLRSDIDVLVERTRIKGVVEGNGTEGLTLKYIRQNDDIQAGDQVITSGLSGVFPKGLTVGEVTRIEKSRDNFFMIVEVRPKVDTRKLEEVLVVADDGGAARE